MNRTDISAQIRLLPNEIQHIILSYTYNTQQSELLEDIRNYYDTKSLLNDMIYESEFMNQHTLISAKDEIHNELCNFIYYFLYDGRMETISMFYFRRYFMYRFFTTEHISNILMENICNYYIDSQINILWGLLTPDERLMFLHIYNDDED